MLSSGFKLRFYECFYHFAEDSKTTKANGSAITPLSACKCKMETLPLDVIPEIAKHLSLKDLIACCSVSIHWRDVFGMDMVWKPHCDPVREEYLRTTSCQVEPKFSSPELANSTLSPIGRWRTAYMREVHLLKNWINGKYVEEEVNNLIASVVSILFLDNHFFIVVLYGYYLELRDSTTNPSVCLAKFKVPEDSVDKIEVIGSLLQSNYRRFFISINMFDKIKVLEINTQSLTITEKHNFSTSERSIIHDFVFVDDVFLGNDSKNLYIWNVESGTNLKTEPLILHSMYSHRVNRYGDCTDVVVNATSTQRLSFVYLHHQHYFLYSVRERRFLKFKKTGTFSGLFRKRGSGSIENYGFAVLSSLRNLDVYDYHASCLLFSVKIPGYSFDSLKILGDSLVYCSDNSDLMCVSLTTGTVECLMSGIYAIDSLNKHKNWLIWEPIRLMKLSTGSSNDIPHVLWKLGSRLTAVSLNMDVDGLFLYTNQSSSKFIRRKEIECVNCKRDRVDRESGNVDGERNNFDRERDNVDRESDNVEGERNNFDRERDNVDRESDNVDGERHSVDSESDTGSEVYICFCLW